MIERRTAWSDQLGRHLLSLCLSVFREGNIGTAGLLTHSALPADRSQEMGPYMTAIMADS